MAFAVSTGRAAWLAACLDALVSSRFLSALLFWHRTQRPRPLLPAVSSATASTVTTSYDVYGC